MAEQLMTFYSISFTLLPGFIILFFIYYAIKKNRNTREKKNMEIVFKQALMQSQLEIQEQTLKNISQEIHDNIGQVLSLAKLNLFTIDSRNEKQQEQKIAASKELVSKAIVDLRDLSHTLTTDFIGQMGLMSSIEYELEMIKKSGSFKASLEISGKPYKFNKQKELILFRIVQETLNNIINNARAGIIEIKASYTNESLELVISDDGRGFEYERLTENENGSGPGLRNMQNRATMIGGTFQIKRTIGYGTRIDICLPKETAISNESK